MLRLVGGGLLILGVIVLALWWGATATPNAAAPEWVTMLHGWLASAGASTWTPDRGSLAPLGVLTLFLGVAALIAAATGRRRTNARRRPPQTLGAIGTSAARALPEDLGLEGPHASQVKTSATAEAEPDLANTQEDPAPRSDPPVAHGADAPAMATREGVEATAETTRARPPAGADADQTDGNAASDSARATAPAPEIDGNGGAAGRQGLGAAAPVELPDGARGFKWLGALTALVFFGGLVAWGAAAPLESAVIMTATVKVEQNRKTLDHPDGGAISDLLVAEGDRVQAGQILMRLDTEELDSELEILTRRLDAQRVREARAQAEQADDLTIAFPADLTDRAASDRELTALMRTQSRLHERSIDAIKGEIALRERRILRIDEQITGLQAQLESVNLRRGIIAEELEAMNTLRRQNLVPLARVLELERRQAELDGEYGQIAASIAEARTSIGETELQIAQIKRERATELETELRESFEEQLDLTPRIRGVKAKIGLADLRAPASGIVLGLNKFTVGGVVRAGEPLLDVVPEDSSLILEARISPTDVDNVLPGASASVRFTAFSQRDTQPADGVVKLVSPDVVIDEATRESYYTGQVTVSADDLAAAGLELQPGMPAEVTIPLGARTAIDYLLEPLLASMNRAMREE